uniref:Uncharacterized protein n=1 Tax=Kalanchoe fedtschenkoi TaxID=63787 RepID=A0A7N0TDT7_KALFE
MDLEKEVSHDYGKGGSALGLGQRRNWIWVRGSPRQADLDSSNRLLPCVLVWRSGVICARSGSFWCGDGRFRLGLDSVQEPQPARTAGSR